MTNNFGREEVAKTSICIDCKGEFDLTVGEVKWYKQKSYPEPKRCCICREKRRLAKEEEASKGGFDYLR